jgi:hypothetical protein
MNIKCPRVYCNGFLYWEKDEDGVFAKCLSCSREFDIKVEPRQVIRLSNPQGSHTKVVIPEWLK